ncbi:MAG TPA: OmpA family protein [Thermoanaerobaculia bacterium]|jgi:outer membrane protein OmpA-like peptidoglycan-associated protein|nr:OmpA family protein [Thermoanaerobaculia bacterium]
MFTARRFPAFIVLFLIAALLVGTTADAQRYTRRDRMWKGSGIGAAIGAAGAYLKGKREADEILAGAAIGGVVGGAIGAYMDRQQERLAHIPGTRVERLSDDTLLVHFNSDVLFDSGSATLDRDGRSTLEQVAEVVNDYRKTAVVIQGHTDSMGDEGSNQDLSERRAQAVESYLTNRGVDSERMTAIGFGESAPVATNANPYGRQRNRRVDVLLKAKSGPLRES